jgi:beta-glucanase (GH16 family)
MNRRRVGGRSWAVAGAAVALATATVIASAGTGPAQSITAASLTGSPSAGPSLMPSATASGAAGDPVAQNQAAVITPPDDSGIPAPAAGSTSPPETTPSAGAAPTVPAGAPVPSVPAGAGVGGPGIAGSWRLAFGDDFDGPALDRTKWQLCNPSFRALCVPYNNERETFNTATVGNRNVTVSGGQLHLTATDEGGRIQSGMVATGPWPAAFGAKPADYRGFSYTYGYYEGRVRIPRGGGFWPSLWELPAQQQRGGLGWPDTGEYDNFEIPGNNPSDYHFTAHWGGGGGGCGHPCSPQAATISDASATWHTFGLDWEPTGLTWYVDGRKMGNTVTTPGAVKNYPFYIIANLSVGGNWGPLGAGVDARTPFPASMDIDYLRVWQHT